MTVVNVLDAKTNLSRLIAEVEAGGEVVIARNNKPVVRLVAVSVSGVAEPALAWQPQPVATTTPHRIPGRLAKSAFDSPPHVAGRSKPKRLPGSMKGLIEWDDRFNDPLPDDELRLWNGEGD